MSITNTRLEQLADAWDNESRVASRSGRADDYARRCADTACAIRELMQLRETLERRVPKLHNDDPLDSCGPR